MRILDETSNKSLENVIVYLTLSEAKELRDSLNEIIQNPSHHHTHVADENFQKEITVCVYDRKDLKGFNQRSKNLILNDFKRYEKNEWEIISEIQKWYQHHCDGNWEHNETIRIYTIDNPGWRVSIDLEGTNLECKPFEQIKLERSEIDWYHCLLRDGKFEGAGGPCNLIEILTSFKNWIEHG